jgi:hypothetical protein
MEKVERTLMAALRIGFKDKGFLLENYIIYVLLGASINTTEICVC